MEEVAKMIEHDDRTSVLTELGDLVILEHPDPEVRKRWLNGALLIAALARVNVGSKVCIRCVIAADGSTISVQQVDIYQHVRLAKRLLESEEVE